MLELNGSQVIAQHLPPAADHQRDQIAGGCSDRSQTHLEAAGSIHPLRGGTTHLARRGADTGAREAAAPHR
jgi:hypothetical protein